MNSLKIANDIAKALISEKKMKLNARIDEIAIETVSYTHLTLKTNREV